MNHILNLGCGGSKIEHIKLEQSNANIIHFDLAKNAEWKNVRGNAECLPFKDKAFEYSVASHVIEHVYNPLLVLKELKRVTQKTVMVRVPNASFYKMVKCNRSHLYSWNEFTFFNILNLVFPEVKIHKAIMVRQKKHYLKKLLNFALVLFYNKNELVATCDVHYKRKVTLGFF